MLTKGAIGNLVNKYRAVLKKCGLLNIFGSLALAGALTVGAAGMAGAVPYDQMGNFTAGTSYDATSGGASDTVVVTKADGAITGTGTVTIDAAKGLEINGVSSAGKLSVGDSQGITVNNGLKLAAGNTATTNDATLVINGTDAEVHMVAGSDGSATITGVAGTSGVATINVINGSLGTTGDDNLNLTGPLGINVTANNGHLICGGALSLDGGVKLTNGNTGTIDGIGSDDGQSFASLNITGADTTYTGNLVVDDVLSDTPTSLSITDEGTLDGTLNITAGNVLMDNGNGGAAVMDGGTLVVRGNDSSVVSTLDSLTVNGGVVDVTSGKLNVTNALTLGPTKGTSFTLAKGAALAADSLASSPYATAADALHYGAYVTLNGDATVANASTLSNGIFNVGGTLTMGGDLTLKNDTVESREVRGAEMTVRNGGTLDMGSRNISITGLSSLEVKDGGTLKLAPSKTITVGGADFGSARTEADGNFVLYGTDAFGTGKIEGGVTLTDGTLKFNGDADISNLMSSTAADGKIFFKHDDSGSGKAGVLSVNKTLTYTGNSLELGDAAGTLQGGELVLNTAPGGDFTMTKGTLMSLGGNSIFGPDGYTVTGYTPGITVGGGTGTLSLTADSSLNLYQSATRTSKVAANKIDVAAGKMNVQHGNWQATGLTVGAGGTLTVGGTTENTGQAGLTVTGTFDTATGATGVADIVNGTLTLDGTVATAADSLNIDDLGQVVTDLNTAYDVNGQSLAAGFGTVKGSGLLTLRNDTGTTEMSLADYKTMTTALQGSNGKGVGVSVDNLTITGTEGATLDSSPSGGTNVQGLGLADVVASVSDPTVALDNSRTDLKGLAVAQGGTTITLGTTTAATLTLKGDATDREFDLDAGGTANLAMNNGSILNLGTVAGDKTYGDLDGSVTLTTAGDTLNVVNGDFTIWNGVAGVQGAEGDIVVSNGTLTTFKPVTDVDLRVSDHGLLWISAQDSSFKDLDLNDGGLKGSNMTVTGEVAMSNGTISDAMDLMLTQGAQNASGSITAEGNITTTDAGITEAPYSELTLSAGGNINVGTGAISATSVTAGEAITAAAVTATKVQAKTLTVSGNVTVTDGVLIATGTGADTSSVGGNLKLSDATAWVGDLSVGYYTEVTGGSFTGANVVVGGNVSFLDGARGSMKTLSLTGANTIYVGDGSDTVGGTTLTVGGLNLNGGSLLIDPAWGKASSNVAVGSFTDGNTTPDLSINGNVGVGMNSMAAIGTTDTNWLTSQVNAATNGAGLTENGVDSALGIYTAQMLDGAHGIVVDGTKTSSGGTAFTFTPNQLDFSGKSLLVVSADAALDPEGALSSNTASGVVNLTDGAKLRIAGAKIGEQYTVLGTNLDGDIAYKDADGNATAEADSTAWVGANLSTDSKLVHLEKSATGEYKGALTSAATFMPKLDGELVKVVNNMALAGNTGAAGEMSETKGVRFLNRAISENYLNNDAAAAVTIESAARMALVGAVPQMTMAASNAAGNAVTQRTGLAQPGGNAIQSMGTDGSMQTGASAGDAAKTGFAMWIMPLYQSSNGFGMKAGNFDMDFSGGLGGVAIGADYTFDNAIRAGITFNIGGGYAQGSGDLNETTNNMNFWGIGAYAGWTPGNFGLTADVNYTSTYNKLEQDLPASMQMGKLKSDVTAYAISAGLRGEYRFETSVMDVTPHVGVRYMSLNTDEYDVKSGGTLLKGDAINQSIWTFPVGVAFSKQIETGNGWHFKPSLDLAVIPAAGDIDARSDVRFTGTGTKAELDTQTMDYVSYMGQAGLEFGNDTTTLGVNYNIQLGAKSTAHGVFGTFRYEF